MKFAFDALNYDGYIRASRCSAIAQLVEQATVNRPVVGSSPTRGATLTPKALFLLGLHMLPIALTIAAKAV